MGGRDLHVTIWSSLFQPTGLVSILTRFHGTGLVAKGMQSGMEPGKPGMQLCRILTIAAYRTSACLLAMALLLPPGARMCKRHPCSQLACISSHTTPPPSNPMAAPHQPRGWHWGRAPRCRVELGCLGSRLQSPLSWAG